MAYVVRACHVAHPTCQQVSLFFRCLFVCWFDRCWAARDSSTLRWGAFWGGIAVTAVVFLFAFGGKALTCQLALLWSVGFLNL